MSDEAISGLMACAWIFTRDCFVAEAPRNDKLNLNLKNAQTCLPAGRFRLSGKIILSE